MKRVAMIAQSRYPNHEGVRRHAEALAREGIAVDVICLRGESEPSSETIGAIGVHRVARVRPKDSLPGYLRLTARFGIAAFCKLQWLDFRRHYDAIQVHNTPEVLMAVALPQKLLGKPIVLTMFDLSVELFRSKLAGRAAALLIPLVAAVEKLSCALADRVIATSYGFQERLIARGVDPDKISLILNTADPRIFQFQTDRVFEPIERGARLLYHGTVACRFGITDAIEALAKLRTRIPESVFHVYGQYDPSYRAELNRQVIALGLAEAVFFHDWVSLEEIREVIRQSDIGVVPYRSDEFMNLALSTKTFEYVASGLPVVASRLRPVQRIFAEESLLFANPRDPNDLADKIASLCLDPDRRREQVHKARAELSEISGEVMIERYLNLMLPLLGVDRNGRNVAPSDGPGEILTADGSFRAAHSVSTPPDADARNPARCGKALQPGE